jgi:hypothetical protein
MGDVKLGEHDMSDAAIETDSMTAAYLQTRFTYGREPLRPRATSMLG